MMSTVAATSPRGPWAVLNNRLFRALWLANVASGVGSTLHDTAAVWTMATLTTSPTLVTMMQTMASLPLFLLALPAGALADIVDRRKVILLAQFGALLACVVLAGFSLADALSPVILLGATFVLGVSVAFTMPTWQALLVELVDRPDLPGAITLGSVSVNVSRAIGPVIAGVILAVANPAAAFLLNAASFIGIIVVLLRWRRPAPPVGAQRERMLGAMVAAVRFTRHSPVVQAVLVRTMGFVFFGIAPISLLPLIVRSRGQTAGDFGALMGAFGVGGIVAAFVALPWLRATFLPDRILGGATWLLAGLTLAVGVVEPRTVLAAILFLAGAAWLAGVSTLTVAGQSAFPDWVRARSSAIALIAFQSAVAVGALVWGQVTAQATATVALGIAAGGLVATLALSRVFPIGRAMQLDLTYSAHWAAHDLPLEPERDDGPVLITIDYTVEAERVPGFRAAVARLRSLRLRDGAFRWSLLESLETPGVFRESFLVGSWGEHLRQHGRATQDDHRIEAEVLAFHAGEPSPRARHFLLQDVTEKTLPSRPSVPGS